MSSIVNKKAIERWLQTTVESMDSRQPLPTYGQNSLSGPDYGHGAWAHILRNPAGVRVRRYSLPAVYDGLSHGLPEWDGPIDARLNYASVWTDLFDEEYDAMYKDGTTVFSGTAYEHPGMADEHPGMAGEIPGVSARVLIDEDYILQLGGDGIGDYRSGGWWEAEEEYEVDEEEEEDYE